MTSIADEDKTYKMDNTDRTAVFLQNVCLKHRFIRSRDTSNIVERPERLRALHIGLVAAIARMEETRTDTYTKLPGEKLASDADELASALGQLNIAGSTASNEDPRVPVSLIHSDASVDVLNNAAVKFIHGDIEGDVYLKNLKTWAKESQDKISQGESEIPSTLSQGDLYLCPESIEAIQGALGTVCQAVDTVVASTSNANQGKKSRRAFVAVRPPGHHCGEDTPSGFCFVNNVAVAAAHAHLQHGINRVVILDIDLHHGNGTQSIVWQINEETYRKAIEQEHGAPPEKSGMRISYGSIHDILSYPCEDGKPELVQAASVSIHGPHGQHIENIHLQPFSTAQQFWDELYSGLYARLLQKASDFLENTGGPGDDVLVFISCGFDASEHEYPSMSRHHRNVPTSFYYQFAQDARDLAERFARGRLISVLEGGYSDRALTSGAMAHLTGLSSSQTGKIYESWWSVENLIELEKATKKRRGGRVSQPVAPAPWLARTLEILTTIDPLHAPPAAPRASVPPSSRVLRDRKIPPSSSGDVNRMSSSGKSTTERKPRSAKKEDGAASVKPSLYESTDSDSCSSSSLSDALEEGATTKKLPRVILRLGPRPGAP